MKRALKTLVLASALGCGTGPKDPVIGDFALSGHFVSDFHLTGCTKVYEMYCYVTDTIDEQFSGSFMVPSAGKSGVYSGAQIAIQDAVFATNGEARFQDGALIVYAATPGSLATGPDVRLTGAFQGDSIVGEITWDYTVSSHGSWKHGTFVARRK